MREYILKNMGPLIVIGGTTLITLISVKVVIALDPEHTKHTKIAANDLKYRIHK